MVYILIIEIGDLDGEYSGIRHDTREKAVEEMQRAWSEMSDVSDVNLFIREV